MKSVFRFVGHLNTCFDLPAREPEPFYRPNRKRVTPYLTDSILLDKHEQELKELQWSGMPYYMARATILTKYAHTSEGLQRRALAAQEANRG